MAEDLVKATVVVADDNPDNVELLRLALEDAGYTVVTAFDGHEALLKVAETNPDLVILDVMMPGKDGFEVCRRLKRWEQTRNIPVLLVTALREVADRIRGIEAGADEFLTKPVDMLELRSRVRALVKAKIYRQQVIEKNALLEKILNRYLPEEVVAKILEDSRLLKLGGVRDFVTVLFADLTGFTSFAESVPPEHVMETLNQTFSRLTKIVTDHHGTFDKYLGDSLMAFYGAPIASDNDALNALRSAVEMREAFQELKAQWGEGPRAQLGLAVGINSGEAIVGNLGSERLMNYTVIGDVVNVAARLEKLASAGQILIGESTYALLQDLVVARKFGEAEIRGRSKPVIAYELVRLFKPA
ncbi:MAG: response regulator [Candidatus Rokubacteria bacterium]|nr:response regulator [Candidatus Rokubacteria bacterium]